MTATPAIVELRLLACLGLGLGLCLCSCLGTGLPGAAANRCTGDAEWAGAKLAPAPAPTPAPARGVALDRSTGEWVRLPPVLPDRAPNRCGDNEGGSAGTPWGLMTFMACASSSTPGRAPSSPLLCKGGGGGAAACASPSVGLCCGLGLDSKHESSEYSEESASPTFPSWPRPAERSV